MIKRRILAVLFIIYGVFNLQSQSIVLSGEVKDSLQNPLENANIIAIPADSTKNTLFAITDAKGRYRLALSKNNLYTVSVSYMGYRTLVFKFTSAVNAERIIVLNEALKQLKEVIIELPVSIKEDTITYNTDKFITGEERKLKNILKKLPGVEIDKNGGVFVQGKKVTTMLVEGKKFFEGGSKLAIENIPADAIDKVQVIDNYNEIPFLKNLIDSDELAMNIMLKKEKKRFAFGAIEAGKGNKNFYETSSDLFYYSPGTNVNFIGNINNTGEKTFTFKDYLNFQGGVNAILKGDGSVFNISASDFSQFMNTEDVSESLNKFGALNISGTINSKLDISGYAILSYVKNNYLRESSERYKTITEEKITSTKGKNILGLGRFNIAYAPAAKEQWFFKSQFKTGDNLRNSAIRSSLADEGKFFHSSSNELATYLNQKLEWHKKISKNHTFSFISNFSIDKKDPVMYWETNRPIFQGLIPFVPSEKYKINQVKRIENTRMNVVFKDYWVLNNFNHIYTTIGNKNNLESFYSDTGQHLKNNAINNFSPAGFGNKLSFEINDWYIGVHYKFKYGITEFKQGAFLHNYNWKIRSQTNLENQKIVVLPDFLATFKFSNSNKLKVQYRIKTSFVNTSALAGRYYLQSYNSVFRGDERLENERYHSAKIYYSRFSMYRGLMFFSVLNYTKKVRGIQNAVQFEGTDHYLYPILVSNPAEQWNLNLNLSKKIRNVKYGVKYGVSNSKFLQIIDTDFVTNQSKSHSYTISAKTLYSKFPTIEFGFKKRGDDYTSSDKISKFVTNEVFVTIDFDFLKGFIYSFDYEKYNYKNKSSDQKQTYQMANTSLFYRKEDSAWSIKIDAQNLFNSNFKQKTFLSSYIVSETKTHVLPRIITVSIGYNF